MSSDTEERDMICCDFCNGWFYQDEQRINKVDVEVNDTYACLKCRTQGHMSTWFPICRLPNCRKGLKSGHKYCCKEHGVDHFRSIINKVSDREKVVAVVNALGEEDYTEFGKQPPQFNPVEEDPAVHELKKELEQWEYLSRYLQLLSGKISELNEQQKVDTAGKNRNNNSTQQCGMDPAAMNKQWDVIQQCVDLNSVESRVEFLCTETKRKCARHVDWMKIANLEAKRHTAQANEKLEIIADEQARQRERARRRALTSHLPQQNTVQSL